MGPVTRRLYVTMQVVIYSLFPAGKHKGEGLAGAAICEPDDIGGMDRFLDGEGKFEVFYPHCLPLAGPFMLFRLKRQGYSACSVRVTEGGLYLRGRR